MTETDAPNRPRKGEAQLIAALAAGATLREAAKQAGIGERTAQRRWADASFRREVDEARAELIRQSVGMLTAIAPKAITTLERLLIAESENVQLGAGRALLELGMKLRESEEIAARVLELERRVGSK